MPLFTVSMKVDGKEHDIDYDSVDACLNDDGLRSLFANHLVSNCALICDGRRITAGPINEWIRLKQQLVSNSTTILRARHL